MSHPKDNKPADKKLTPDQVKALQETTKSKQGKIVKK